MKVKVTASLMATGMGEVSGLDKSFRSGYHYLNVISRSTRDLSLTNSVVAESSGRRGRICSLTVNSCLAHTSV